MSGMFIEVNEVAYARLGYTYEEMLNMSPFEIDVHEKEEVLKIIDNVNNNETTTFETVHICKDGSQIPVEIKTHTLYENGDKYILSVCRDISERKKSEEFYVNSEKLSIIGKLAASIAHEIRNPLTSIKGFLKLSKEGVFTLTDSDMYSILDTEIDRIETIASELLILGKPVENNLKVLDIGQLLNEVCIVMQSQANIENIIMQSDHIDGQLYCECIEEQIKQVFMNLIKNALEAVRENGIITISAYSNIDEIIIKIADNGTGIPSNIKSKIGEPFYTTKEKGTGLGLMACYKIVNQHEGKVEFNSTEGIGTTFTIRLPKYNDNKITS
jgi:two-component system sporulation sensor kinase A